jgi:hypothetical protein
VSTVTNRWVEGRNSILYREDPVGKGATFEHASYGTSFWTKEGSSLRDVVMGKGYSLFQRSEPLPTGGRWWKVELDQNIIRALVTESSYGLYVTGEWGEVSRECSIHASESGKYAPYLLLECQPAREVEIPAPDFLAEREADEDGVPTGRIVISLDVPAGVFSYDILVNSDPVPRWEIPLAAAPGTKQKFTVHGPRDEGAVPVKMFAIGHVGDASDPARVRADLPIPTIEAPAE